VKRKKDVKHIISHTRIKMGLGEVLDERRKEEVVKWMREVKETKKDISDG